MGVAVSANTTAHQTEEPKRRTRVEHAGLLLTPIAGVSGIIGFEMSGSPLSERRGSQLGNGVGFRLHGNARCRVYRRQRDRRLPGPVTLNIPGSGSEYIQVMTFDTGLIQFRLNLTTNSSGREPDTFAFFMTRAPVLAGWGRSSALPSRANP